MKKIIIAVLSILATLSAAPTAWAIYAGVRKLDVFPMWPPAAISGAIAIIATSIAAGLLVTDIKAYNQGMKNQTERKELGMSTGPAWFVLGGCVLAEITLSLLIVVIPGALPFGVLVFPLMTLAGVFAFAVRFDLLQRERERTEQREARHKPADSQPKPAKKQEAASKKPAELEIPAALPVLEPALQTAEPAEQKYFCLESGCPGNPKTPDGSFGTQSALNAHGRKHKPAIVYAVPYQQQEAGSLPISEER
jgi:hypothetical protein